jgi:hypothetical protein
MTTIPDIDLQSALNDQLNDEFPTMAIAWENVDFTPALGTPYLAAYLLPAESTVKTLGPNPYIERKGIFQVTCVYPAGAGWGAAKSKAAEVIAAFPAGQEFVYNGLTVTIEKSWPAAGFPKDGWYQVPTSIRYHCIYQG